MKGPASITESAPLGIPGLERRERRF